MLRIEEIEQVGADVFAQIPDPHTRVHLSGITETETRPKEDELQSWPSANDF